MDTTSPHANTPMYIEEDGSGETVIENTSHKTPTPTPGHEQTPVSTSAGEINDDPTPGTSADITNNEMGNSPSPTPLRAWGKWCPYYLYTPVCRRLQLELLHS